jgi:hypothetical protein
MNHLVRRLGAALSFLLASSLAAQSISVASGPLSAGANTTIGVNDPSKAGSTVCVTISSQGPNPERVQVFVTLNGQGSGEVVWPVPAAGWTKAYFNCTTCPQVFRTVQ